MALEIERRFLIDPEKFINLDTVKWKRCDLKHNSNLDRLKGITQKDLERTVKYHLFYSKLKNL